VTDGEGGGHTRPTFAREVLLVAAPDNRTEPLPAGAISLQTLRRPGCPRLRTNLGGGHSAAPMTFPACAVAPNSGSQSSGTTGFMYWPMHSVEVPWRPASHRSLELRRCWPVLAVTLMAPTVARGVDPRGFARLLWPPQLRGPKWLETHLC